MLIIAYLSMFVDHIYRFMINQSILPPFGRVAMPIFAYMLAKGMKRTRSQEKYMLRLLILALVSQIPYTLMIDKLSNLAYAETADLLSRIMTTIVFFTKNLNIGFELLLGAIVIRVIENKKLQRLDKFILISLIIYLIETIHIGTWHRIAVILLFYKLDMKNIENLLIGMASLSVIISAYIAYIISVLYKLNPTSPNSANLVTFLSVEFYSIAALIVIYYFESNMLENEKLGILSNKKRNLSKRSKILKYSIYPIHLILIAAYRMIYLV